MISGNTLFWSFVYKKIFGFFIMLVFSLPKLKAQVSVSDRLSSIVCLPVRPYVCKLFTVSSSFPERLGHIQPTWYILSFRKWDSSLFKWRTRLFSIGGWQLNVFISWTNVLILTKLGKKYSLMIGIQVCSDKSPQHFKGEIITILGKIYWQN